MDSTQTAYALAPPAFDPFGGPHFTADGDEAAGSPPAWIGDPSSVPLPAESDQTELGAAAENELDRAIFAALITP